MFTEQQDKWLRRVEELFLRYGIKNFTMDDVARELGISKKTLYQFVENKDDLVGRVMDRHIAEQCKIDQELHANATDAVDELLNTIKEMMREMQKMKPHIIHELQKYHREVWERIQAFQQTYVYKVAMANIEWGRREALYRTDFDADIAVRIYIASCFAVLNDDVFPKPPYSLDTLFRECMFNYLHSIVSDEGRKLIKEKNILI
jgi:TetR/AcrR family transcriptional regulator, cholesterol catabolism regulator